MSSDKISIKLIADIKLGSGADSIREVWFDINGKEGSILLRGPECHDKDINSILKDCQNQTEKYIKRETDKKINGRLRKIRKIE